MISPTARNELWQNLLDINRMCRYYESLHSINTRKHFVVRVATLVLITGGITAVLDVIPNVDGFVTKTLVALPAVVLTIWDALANYSKKAAVAHASMVQSAKLRAELQDIWLEAEDDDVDEAGIRRRARELSFTIAEIEGWAGANDLQVDQKLNERTAKDAYKVVAERYGAKARVTE